MNMQQHLTSQLTVALSPSHLEVINESHNHAGDASESHFKLVVVSEDFADLSLIARHRQINTLFKAELESIHALAIHAYTGEEWVQKKQVPDSPLCQGGSK